MKIRVYFGNQPILKQILCLNLKFLVILEGKKSSVIIETHDVKYIVRWEIELMHDGLGEACTEKLQSFASMDFTGRETKQTPSSSSFKSSKQSKANT